MDPDVTLAQMRLLVEDIALLHGSRFRNPKGNTSKIAELGVELAEAVQALDGWMKADGYPPRDWQ